MKIDYHIHTRLCKHASGEMVEYVEQAIAQGFDEIAFTDHIPLPQGFDQAHRMTFQELDDYLTEVEKLKTRYREIRIVTGIEADFYDGFEDFLAQFLRKFPFQIVILSVHFIRHWPKGNWAFSYHFPNRPLKEVYSDYLQAVMRGIETGLFNVVGHLDLIKRDGQPLLQQNRAEVRQVLQKAQKHQMAVEINTSGLRKEIGETFPHSSIWPLLAEYGLPVTMGSDAHAPTQVGFAFETVEKKLATIPNLQKVRWKDGAFQPVAWQTKEQVLTK